MNFSQGDGKGMRPTHIFNERLANQKSKLPVKTSQTYDEIMDKFKSPEARNKYRMKMQRIEKNE